MRAQHGYHVKTIEAARHAQIDDHHCRIDVARDLDGARRAGLVTELVTDTALEAMGDDVRFQGWRNNVLRDNSGLILH
jgi:hypothetical protein